MTRMFACQTQNVSTLCKVCYDNQEIITAERLGEAHCDECSNVIPEDHLCFVVATPKLYFVLVDDLTFEKAKDVVATVTREMGLKDWEYSELDTEMLEQFKDHKREILYEATNELDVAYA